MSESGQGADEAEEQADDSKVLGGADVAPDGTAAPDQGADGSGDPSSAAATGRGDGPTPIAGESVHALRDEFPVGELSLDEVFALLADRRRRFALHALHATDEGPGVTDLPHLTRQVVGREATADREFEAETGNGAVRRDLDDRVLPQLDDAGVLDYDGRSGAVRFYGHPVVEEYLGHVRGLEWGG